jgi:hypothetical protein
MPGPAVYAVIAVVSTVAVGVAFYEVSDLIVRVPRVMWVLNVACNAVRLRTSYRAQD